MRTRILLIVIVPIVLLCSCSAYKKIEDSSIRDTSNERFYIEISGIYQGRGIGHFLCRKYILELYPDSTFIIKCKNRNSIKGQYWLGTFKYKDGDLGTLMWMLYEEDMFVYSPDDLFKRYEIKSNKVLKMDIDSSNNEIFIKEKNM